MSRKLRECCSWCNKPFIEGDADVLKDNIVICSYCINRLDEALQRRQLTIEQYLNLTAKELLMLCD